MNRKIMGLFVLGLVISPIIAATETEIVDANSDGSQIDAPSPTVKIVRPREGFLYICDKEIIHVGATIIIGPCKGIEVYADVNEGERTNVDHIEFFVNNKLVGVGTWNPFTQYYTWTCNKIGFGPWILNAEAVTVGNECNLGTLDAGDRSNELSMFYFNINFS